MEAMCNLPPELDATSLATVRRLAEATSAFGFLLKINRISTLIFIISCVILRE
jgi:hypothetical protein